MYKPGTSNQWIGRKDTGGTDDLWHQVIRPLDLNAQTPASICFLGFCTDIGVKRNLGRTGAVAGPDAIRNALSNLANHHGLELSLSDGGDVIVSGEELEIAQLEVARYLSNVLQQGSFPILLGGGHEISYAHGQAVCEAHPGQKVGIINFDPHFDLRAYTQGAHSGSWARQLFDEYDRFSYFPVGIDPAANLASMFEFMQERGQGYLSMEELQLEREDELSAKIKYFEQQVDVLAITVDLDVFSSGIAPGVSALNPNGIFPEKVKPLLREMMKSEKVVSMDVAEMNPTFDDGRTAKLAASLIYTSVEAYVSR